MISIRETLPACQEILPAPAAQLPRRTGPLGIVRVRRERTTGDREWYAAQLAVQHSKHWDKVVYERVSYYGSLNPERLAFPSVARVAREVLCSARTVQRALRRLEVGGLIKCVSRVGGRATAQYLVVGRSVTPGQAASRARGDSEAPNDLREGTGVSTKSSSFNASVKSIDPVPIQTEGPKKEIICTILPSQEKTRAKAPVSKEQDPAPSCEPEYRPSKPALMLFKLQRKLGYSADDGQAKVFDGLQHADKKRILDKLLSEEQLAAARGEVEAPPPKPRAPRFNPVSTAPKRAEPPSCVTDHRWSEAASDGVQNCVMCPAEQCATHRWTAPASDGVQNCTLCNVEQISVGA